MKLPLNESFIMFFDVTPVNVRHSISAFILFPMQTGYLYLESTDKTTISRLFFDIPPLKDKILSKGRGFVNIIIDEKRFQRLVFIDYELQEDNKIDIRVSLDESSELNRLTVNFLLPEEETIDENTKKQVPPNKKIRKFLNEKGED